MTRATESFIVFAVVITLYIAGWFGVIPLPKTVFEQILPVVSCVVRYFTEHEIVSIIDSVVGAGNIICVLRDHDQSSTRLLNDLA